jgi:hypothetical protein
MIDQAIHQPEDTFAEITDEITMPFAKEKDDMIIGIRVFRFETALTGI